MKDIYSQYRCRGMVPRKRRRDTTSRYQHVDEDLDPAENTPLIRMPTRETVPDRNFKTMLSVLVLILIFVIGAVVGIYLIVIQNESENVLPPAGSDVMAKRAEVVAAHRMHRALFSSNKVYVSDTDSSGCATFESCNDLIKKMQENKGDIIPYHLFVASNGILMKTDPAPSWENGFNITLFGNYSDKQPPPIQVKGVGSYLAHATHAGYLDPYYKVIVKKGRDHNLYKSFQKVKNFCGDCTY